MNDVPVFQDAGHALHVSYLIHSMPARTVSPTAIVIDQLVKENHVWEGLPEPRSSGVNFAGLSPLEVAVAYCCEAGWQGFNAGWYAERNGAARGAASGETAYQRSMRERMQEAVPAIARKAPGAPAMQAVEFFNTVEAAPALRIGSLA